MLVYHATTASNAGHIKTEGLKINQPGNWDDIRTNDCIFFAFSAEVAIDYVETSDTYDDSKVVVFSVDTSDLDMDSIGYDWNNRCEELDDINSFAYYEEVPATCHISTQTLAIYTTHYRTRSCTRLKHIAEYNLSDLINYDVFSQIIIHI